MDKNAFYEKYIASEEDIYTSTVGAMGPMAREEYWRKVAARRSAYRRLESAAPDAVDLLHQYEELRTDCETILANCMFMYGAEIMEKTAR